MAAPPLSWLILNLLLLKSPRPCFPEFLIWTIFPVGFLNPGTELCIYCLLLLNFILWDSAICPAGQAHLKLGVTTRFSKTPALLTRCLPNYWKQHQEGNPFQYSKLWPLNHSCRSLNPFPGKVRCQIDQDLKRD